MSGELHEISRAIGAQESSLKGLKESFDRHCDDDDRRHDENIKEMRAIRAEISRLAQAIEPLATRVATMGPIVDSYQLTRSKLAAWASIGVGVIVVLGWAIEVVIKLAVTWVLSHLH